LGVRLNGSNKLLKVGNGNVRAGKNFFMSRDFCRSRMTADAFDEVRLTDEALK